MIESSIQAWLLTQVPVTQIVGSGGVFLDDVPMGTPDPYYMVTETDEDQNLTLDGRPPVSGAMYTDEIDIDSKATTRDEADSNGIVVDGLFRDFSGSLGSGLETVLAVEFVGKTKGKDPPLFDDDVAFFRTTFSYRVYYRPLT